MYIISGGYHNGNRLDTTEILQDGMGKGWVVSSAKLPRKLYAMASISLEASLLILGKLHFTIQCICWSLTSHLIFVGGWDEEGKLRSEVLRFDGEKWTDAGKMDTPRSNFAAVRVKMSDVNQEICV